MLFICVGPAFLIFIEPRYFLNRVITKRKQDALVWMQSKNSISEEFLYKKIELIQKDVLADDILSIINVVVTIISIIIGIFTTAVTIMLYMK